MSKKPKLPQGYYIHKTNLSKSIGSSESYEYKVMVYVEEVDKYNGGISKINLVSLEIISGFDPSQFDYVKRATKSKFISIKNTSDIEWLVSENDIKQERKEKLDKINKKNFIQRLFSK